MPTSARREVANLPKIFVKSGMYCRADVGIGPYKRMRKRIRICRRITQNRNTLLQNLYIRALIAEIRISPATTRSSAAKPVSKLSEYRT